MAFFKLRERGNGGGNRGGKVGGKVGNGGESGESGDGGRRRSRDSAAATPPQAESVEALRRRARHRLIGAGVLVLIGVVGFPLLFDTQPRPIAVDIPIEIPDRNKVKPLPPQKGATAVPGPSAVPPHARSSAASPSAAASPAGTAEAPSRPEAKAEARPDSNSNSNSKPEARPGDGPRAQALLEGKPVNTTPPAEDGRFIVQVGAFSDTAKMRETRARLERAGIKTYTHVAETKDGKLTRVRVGPFASKADADQAAQKIKALDLSPHVLKL